MSFSETIFLFFLALIIFGPKKLPEIARQVGKALNEFKRASNEFRAQIEQEIAHLEVDNRPTILPPSEPPAGATSRSRYAGTELDASSELPALTAAAAVEESVPGENSSIQSSSIQSPSIQSSEPQASETPDQASPSAPHPSEDVTASDPVGAAATPDSPSPESHA
ncbi:MAG TPA: twin-arginine translocase TatA/TatE family subunit [Candidatus Sulfotelmatobacter sp.]